MGIAYIIVSIVPIMLLVYIWYLDRLEHEPIGAVAAVFVASALLGTAAAAAIEELGGFLLGATPLGSIPVFSDFIYFFFVVALVEEFCKRFPVMRIVWNHSVFDYRFDIIVYCVASAIGFAVAENIMYVGVYGAEVTIGRLIPVHTICGVLAIPVAIHGAWDFCVSANIDALAIAAMVGIVVLTIYAWHRLHLYAKHDAPL